MQYYIQLLCNALSLASIYALIGIGYALIYGILKFSNFSHGASMVTCAYIAYFLTRFGIKQFWLVLILSALAGGFLNMLIELIAFRRLRIDGKNIVLFFVSSVTVGMLVENILVMNFSEAFYSYPSFFKTRFLNIGGISIDFTDIVMISIAVVFILGLALVMNKTWLGLKLRAISEDTSTGGLMGINVTRIIMATFFVAGVAAAFAGFLIGVRTILTPQLGSLYVVKGFIVAVLGGLGSISGALWGALLLGVVETIFNVWIGSAAAPIGLFFFALLFLYFRPSGISGMFHYDKA